jgi:hypothetical protein
MLRGDAAIERRRPLGTQAMSITHSRSAIAIEADQHIGRAAIESAGARRLAVAVAVASARMDLS